MMQSNRRFHLMPVATLGAAIAIASSAFADEGDDALQSYLAKSDLVLAGRIQSQPDGVVSELGVVHYIFEFRISDVLKGNMAADRDLPVEIVRFEFERGDELPWMRKGSKAILFLRQAPEVNIPRWISADMWFGIQPPNRHMEKSLKTLAAAAEKKQAENHAPQPGK